MKHQKEHLTMETPGNFPREKEDRAMSIARSATGEQIRQRVMEAALHLFSARGYAGTSTQAIIAASKVSKPTLYYHFGSKAGLFRVVVDEAENELLGVILKSKTGPSGVPRKLVGICAAMFQFAHRRPSVIGLALEVPSEARRCPFWKQRLGRARQRHAAIGEIMERGRDEGILRQQFSKDELVIAFLGLVHNQIFHFLANRQWPLNRRTAEGVVALFLKGTVNGNTNCFLCPTS
jgi:AcrR family transcriptional regulator